MPELGQPGLLSQLQHLQEQVRQRRQMPFAEIGDGAEIGPVVRDDHHEINALDAGLGDAPRGVKSGTIGVKQKRGHQAGIERRLAERALVGADDLRQIEALAHQRDHEMGQVIRRHVIRNRRRQQLSLINLPRPKRLAHAD
ncbi:hypothetical protein M2323_004620 [Rhodoblastus acidophilus]|nr:hypothetical protein [Rhodoblastus acidophilus]MCW2335668.1 hypothetical protein [Rhodoblastus acidophilus]